MGAAALLFKPENGHGAGGRALNCGVAARGTHAVGGSGDGGEQQRLTWLMVESVVETGAWSVRAYAILLVRPNANACAAVRMHACEVSPHTAFNNVR